MDIITKKRSKVNVFEEWGKHKLEAVQISKMLKLTNIYTLVRRGENMSMCATLLSYAECTKCHETKITRANLCRDKLCPVCGWRLARQRFAEMLRCLDWLDTTLDGGLADKHVALLTLTVKNCYVNEINSTCADLISGWKRFNQSKLIKENVCGWARSLEITYNRKTGKAHPHYHVLLILNSNNDTHPVQMDIKLRELWKRSARLNYTPQTNYQIAYAKTREDENEQKRNDVISAAAEAFKYSIKFTQIKNLTVSELGVLALQIAGIRMVSYGGVIKLARKELGLLDEEEAVNEDTLENGEPEICCESCGSPAIEMLAKWSETNALYVTNSQRS